MAEAYLDGEAPAQVSCTSDMTGKKTKERKELFHINTHPMAAPDLAAKNKRDKRLKQIVMRVVAFCKKEHEEGLQVPLHFFKKRASLMTGVSLSTIHRIETIDMKCDASDVAEQMEDKKKDVKVKKADDDQRKKQMKKKKGLKGKSSVNQGSCSVSCDRTAGQAMIQTQVAVTAAYPSHCKPGVAVNMPAPLPARAMLATPEARRQGKGELEDKVPLTNTHSSLSLLASAAVSLGPVNLFNSQHSGSASVHSSLGSSSNSSMDAASPESSHESGGVSVSGLHLAPSAAAVPTLQPLSVQPASTWHILTNLPNLPTQLSHQRLGNPSGGGSNHGTILVSGAGACMGQLGGEMAGQLGGGSVRTVQVLGAGGMLAAADAQQRGAQQQSQWAGSTGSLPSLGSFTVGGQPFLQQQKLQQAPPCQPLQVLDGGSQPLIVNGSSLVQQQQLHLPLYQQLQQLLFGTTSSGLASQTPSVPRHSPLPGQTPPLTALQQTGQQPGLTMPLSSSVSWGTWQPATVSYVNMDTTNGQPSSSLMEGWGQVMASTSLGQHEFQPCNPPATRTLDSLGMECGSGEDSGSVRLVDLDRVDVTCGPGVTITGLEDISLTSGAADVVAMERLNVTGSMENVSMVRENTAVHATPVGAPPHLYQQLHQLQTQQQLPSHFYHFS